MTILLTEVSHKLEVLIKHENAPTRKRILKILNLQVFVEIEHDYHMITVLSIMNAYGLQWYVISENIQTNW